MLKQIFLTAAIIFYFLNAENQVNYNNISLQIADSLYFAGDRDNVHQKEVI